MADADDLQFLAHLMYDVISQMITNILDDDIPAALQLGAAILNDYESICDEG